MRHWSCSLRPRRCKRTPFIGYQVKYITKKYKEYICFCKGKIYIYIFRYFQSIKKENYFKSCHPILLSINVWKAAVSVDIFEWKSIRGTWNKIDFARIHFFPHRYFFGGRKVEMVHHRKSNSRRHLFILHSFTALVFLFISLARKLE